MTVPLLTSRVLTEPPGIVHGFTTREGGLSVGSYASLNLGTRTDDERSVVETNRRHVLTSLERTEASFVSLRQVHGADLVEVNHLAGRSIPADGLWTRDPKALIAVLVADCVPILITDQTGSFAAAVHAGWRGTKERIVAKMIERLESAGIEPSELRVAIGPAIGPCCFEIGEEVADELRGAYPNGGEAIRTDERGRRVADLWALNEQAAREAGALPLHTDTLRHCTHCDERFYSHRRDGPGTGRQAGVIGLRG